MSNFEPILSEFLTKEELAAELQRNPRTLDRWDVLGVGPPRTHVGRQVLYRRTSVQKWLCAQEHRPWDVRYDGRRAEARNAPNLPVARVCSDCNDLAAFLWWTVMSIIDIATEAAARLNLTRGRDNKWRGRCPVCGYAKHSLEVAVEQDRIAVSCSACGAAAGIAAIMGVDSNSVIASSGNPAKVARAIKAWRKADLATGSLVERYLRGRGITLPPPVSIRFLPRQRNWSDGGIYPAMIALVQRVRRRRHCCRGARCGTD